MEFHKYKDTDHRGTIERVCYSAKDAQGDELNKYANVYLPYGYCSEEKYNVLYVIHGGGGNPDAWLDTCQMKNMLDQSFDAGRAKPFILVFPTYYTEEKGARRKDGVPVNWENEQILFFQKELHEVLIPIVESRYSTYLSETSEAGMRASRMHRAITGFSMGGGTTWYAFLKNMDVIATFLPLSGDCWGVAVRGGQTHTVETVNYMIEQVKTAGFGRNDFRVFAGTGSKDIAYPALDPMIEEMKKHTEMFAFSEDYYEGNLHYEVVADAPHTYESVYQHIYNYLPVIFK